MRTPRNSFSLVSSVISVGMAIAFLPIAAVAQTPFYQGKTITVIQGRDPAMLAT